MIRTGQSIAEVHGVLFQRERRVQVDLTLTRGIRNTTKRMLVNGQRPSSRADLSEALPLTVFTPEGVDIVRQGPENRRVFLTNLLTDVDLTTGDVIERFNRMLEPTKRAAAGAAGRTADVGAGGRTGRLDDRLLSRERAIGRTPAKDH